MTAPRLSGGTDGRARSNAVCTAASAGQDPDSITICPAAPACVTDGTDAGDAHGRTPCGWFGGMAGNDVADIIARYGADGTAIPAAHQVKRLRELEEWFGVAA